MKTWIPHAYQKQALEWLIRRTVLQNQQGAGLFLDPGLGKTSITLAWLRALRVAGLMSKALIVAPKRVCELTWPDQTRDWQQFSEFKCSEVLGDQTSRMRAISQPADLYLINPEGLEFLLNYYRYRTLPWEVLVIDESSKFKTWGSKRTKILRKLVPRFSKRLILTGTPSPNGLEDLFAQIFIIDQGERLGTAITPFRERWFFRGGYGGYQYLPHAAAQENIEKMIQDCCLVLRAEDHLDMPELLVNDVWVDLPTDARQMYQDMEKKLFLELDSGTEIVPLNTGSKYGLCCQIAQGGLYETKEEFREGKKPRKVRVATHHFHQAKIEAVADIVEELQGKPVLVGYLYDQDLDRLRKRWPKIPAINAGTKDGETRTLVEKWNAGKLTILAAQPQAMSHGLNMQGGPGRDVVCLGIPDQPETYQQFIARVYRQGVGGQVRVHRILARRTVDVAKRDRLDRKAETQHDLLEALKNYRKEGSRT